MLITYDSGFGVLGALYEYDSGKWSTFLNGSASAAYQDDAVFCAKDAANRPVCRRLSETTSTAQRRGAVARLQESADKLINLIPMYRLNGVKLADGSQFFSAFEPSPILKRSGYDGLLGPSTHGWVNGAVILATALAPIPRSVIEAVTSPTEAMFARHAADLAAYFDDVAMRFDDLVAAHKVQPRPLPQLAPETIEIVREVVIAKKRKTLATGAVVALGGAALTGLAVFGLRRRATPSSTFLMGSRNRRNCR